MNASHTLGKPSVVFVLGFLSYILVPAIGPRFWLP